MTYTQIFGGTTIYPSDVSYLALALSADKALEWPLESNDPANPAARIIDVTTTGAYSITLPDATQTGAGQTLLFNNLSASTNSFTLKDYAGNTIATVGIGEQWQAYLAGVATAAGTWRVFRYGASTATVQASALAGYGLTVTSNTLSQSLPVTTFNSTRSVLATDRASALVWTGTGTGTLNLIAAGTVGNNFFIAVRNSGGGDLTVDAAGSETIDGAGTLALRPGESTNLMTDGVTWYTLGLGQEAVFAFDYTSITVTGGTYTLAGSELNRIAYKFVGTLAADQYIVVPSTIQQYWVDNGTTGAYNFYLQTSGGTPVSVPQGGRGIYYCNGTNVVDADTATISLPVSATDGGTGQTSYTTGDLLYASSATTLAKLSDVAVGNVLRSGGVGVAPAWGKAVLTTDVSGTLPVANGGTGATTFTANGLIYGNTTSALQVTAAGTTGQVLVGNTGSAPSWAALSSSAVTSISFGSTGLTPSTATQGAVTVAGTLGAANGGTGQNSYTTGDLIYASGATALAKLADVATGNALLSGGVGVAPAWGKIGLTTHVSGTLPVANGGTGATTLTGYVKGSGTSAFTASATVPASDLSGTLGVANGGTGTSTAFTAGSVVFAGASGVYSQDNANLFWDDTNNRLGIGLAAPVADLHVQKTGAGPEIRASGVSPTVSAYRSANNANGPSFILNKSRGSALARTAITSGDVLGEVTFQGFGGTNERTLGFIRTVADTYTSDADISSYMSFATSVAGAAAAFERMRITSAGNVGIGTTTPDANGKVDILGNIDPGTTPAALSVRNTGVAGGTAAAQYGIRVSSQTYNNATASYGIYAFSYQNVGNATYGIWGDAGSSSFVGNSLTPFYGVVGRAYFNSAASHTLTNGNLPVGVYGTVVSTGSTNTAISAAGYFTNAATFGSEAYGIYVNVATGPTTTIAARFDFAGTEVARIDSAGGILSRGTGGIGYRTGAGGTVTQATSRTTGVTLNTVTGSITLVSAAGTATWQSFTVTNSAVAANDVVIVSQRSGADLYLIHVTNVAAGSFQITFATTGGTTTEQPVFNFAVIKGATS